MKRTMKQYNNHCTTGLYQVMSALSRNLNLRNCGRSGGMPDGAGEHIEDEWAATSGDVGTISCWRIFHLELKLTQYAEHDEKFRKSEEWVVQKLQLEISVRSMGLRYRKTILGRWKFCLRRLSVKLLKWRRNRKIPCQLWKVKNTVIENLKLINKLQRVESDDIRWSLIGVDGEKYPVGRFSPIGQE